MSLSVVKNYDNSMVFPFKRATFLSTYFRYQEWPFPDSLIYHLTKNPPTPEAYSKLIQTCKYFFIKNPIIIISRLYNGLNQRTYKEWKTFFNTKSVDLSNFQSKIWITDKISIANIFKSNPYFSTIIFPKIYKCDIKELKFDHQNIVLNDLKFLVSKVEKIWLNELIVMDEDGTVVGLEKIIEILPNIQEFRYDLCTYNLQKIISAKTVPKLLKIPFFSKINSFVLIDIPDAFDINSFYKHIMINTKTKFIIKFCDELSEGYSAHLQAIVNEIIVAAENPDFKVPYIRFAGIEEQSLKKLYELYHRI